MNTPHHFMRSRTSGFARNFAALLLTLTALWAAIPAPAATTFNYTLDGNYKTSAGVYRSDGTLVKTLWRGVSRSVGANSGSWDETDDSGNAVPVGTYTIRVLRHNVQYVWEGVVGNTSASQVGKNIHRAFTRIHSMSSTGTSVFFATGYNEGQTCFHRFEAAAPQVRTGLLHADAFTAWKYVATDGTLTYWAHPSGGIINEGKTTMVIATKVSDNTMNTFPSGQSICLNYNGATCYPDQFWPSCISVMQSGTPEDPQIRISGLAVQRGGAYLFVAYNGRNEIRVLNKTTGALVGTYSVAGGRFMAPVGTNGLWVLCTVGGTTSLKRYSVAGNGALTLQATTVNGLVQPANLAVSADNATLLVLDGGSSAQQVKGFNATNGGNALWTLGQNGGHSNDPTVANDKLSVWDGDNGSFVACQDDGSFWVGDPANHRTIHFSAARNYLEHIMYLPHSYCAAVDLNDPTRVFGDFLEFSVDYSKPLGGSNGSWSLKKNWGANLPGHFLSPLQAGLKVVATLRNGRTYALVSNDSTPGQQSVVELPASGYLRFTGISVNNDTMLYADGSLRTVVNASGRTNMHKFELTGFDASGNPQWAPATTVASAPATAGDPYFQGGSVTGPRVPISSSGVVISFDQSKNFGQHLGGVRSGSGNWWWKASPSTTANYTGPMPGDGTYDIGNGVQYAGNIPLATGRHVFYGYNGEFWKNTQANQWMHFYDDGLFVGQFGTLGTVVPHDEAIAGFAGNSFSPHLVWFNGKPYLWHNDESNHAGVHRWRMDGLETVRHIAGSGPLNSAINLQLLSAGQGLKADYFENTNFTGNRVSQIDAGVNFDWAGNSPVPNIGADTFSVRWIGQVRPRYAQTYTFYTITDDGVRLWVNGQLLIDKWIDQGPTEWSGSIALAAGQLYDLKMEFYENAVGATARLAWSSASQSKEIIPQDRLYVGTGLRGEYYDNQDLTNLKFTRLDPVINANWQNGSPDPTMGADTFSVRWTGRVQPSATETYTFYTTSDDGVRLWVNGVQIINNWTDHAASVNSGTITLTAGQTYDIRMEYYENGGGSIARLEWSSPSTPRDVVPVSALHPPNPN